MNAKAASVFCRQSNLDSKEGQTETYQCKFCIVGVKVTNLAMCELTFDSNLLCRSQFKDASSNMLLNANNSESRLCAEFPFFIVLVFSNTPPPHHHHSRVTRQANRTESELRNDSSQAIEFSDVWNRPTMGAANASPIFRRKQNILKRATTQHLGTWVPNVEK